MSLRSLTVPTLVLSLTSLACGSEPPPDAPDERARRSSGDPSAAEILAQAATALRAVETVRYDFEYGGPDDPTGWLHGTTWMRQRSDLAESWIRVEGTVRAQPELGVTETTFAYATDGEQAWAREGDATLETAAVGAGANRLSARAVYGYLPEFVEAEPLWRERYLSTKVELLEPTT
ncbi:MAG: hypothetical protein R3244_13880, partial [Thermoanaerobaculia bacterium]|nr:hypothetical protein [Thermoanaerobaculia bacterium]